LLSCKYCTNPLASLRTQIRVDANYSTRQENAAQDAIFKAARKKMERRVSFNRPEVKLIVWNLKSP